MGAQARDALSTWEREMRERLGNPMDLVFRTFVTNCHGMRRGLLVCVSGLAEERSVEAILEAVTRLSLPLFDPPQLAGDPLITLKETVLRQAKLKVETDVTACVEAVLAGKTVLFLDGSQKALVVNTIWNPGRSVSEPTAEAEVRGPRDGMVEDIHTNLALMRRRIADPRLHIEPLRLGKRSNTRVAVAYIKGIAPDGVVQEVFSRLKRINVDALSSAGKLEEFIRDSPTSPFPTTLVTERPDKLAAAILEGRVAIFVDGSPFVILVPITLWGMLQAPGDYYQSFIAGTAFRWIRFLAFLVALTLPSAYVMLTTFHHEMIPTPLALTIAAGREGTPLPTVFEVLLMEVMFEVMHEAGLRLPRAVGQTVSIVGALVIGQAAVRAGLIAPGTVIVVATTGIGGFAIPVYTLSITTRMLRFPLLLLSGTLGVFGFWAGTAVLALHATGIRSFGVPFLSPVAPYRGPEQADTLVRAPRWKIVRRPDLGGGTSVRLPPGQKPEPPGRGSS